MTLIAPSPGDRGRLGWGRCDMEAMYLRVNAPIPTFPRNCEGRSQLTMGVTFKNEMMRLMKYVPELAHPHLRGHDGAHHD